jgi:hypothetical protein
MTTTRDRSPATGIVPESLDPISEQIVGQTFDLARAVVADPSILDEIPNGCTLVLLPQDADEAFVEANLAIALRAARRGRNVYIRHVAPGEWSVGPDPEEGRGE